VWEDLSTPLPLLEDLKERPPYLHHQRTLLRVHILGNTLRDSEDTMRTLIGKRNDSNTTIEEIWLQSSPLKKTSLSKDPSLTVVTVFLHSISTHHRAISRLGLGYCIIGCVFVTCISKIRHSVPQSLFIHAHKSKINISIYGPEGHLFNNIGNEHTYFFFNFPF